MVVQKAGRIVFERYAEGRSPAQLSSLASGTKSFWGPAAAAMIADGLITGFDELASLTLTEWRSDPRRSRITLRHLLSLTSGLAGDVEALQGQGTAANKYAAAIQAEATAEPGTSFAYGPVNFYVFGEIARRKLAGRRMDPLAYLDTRILKPLGIRRYEWIRDPSGNPHIPNGCSLAARDWLTYGEFLRLKGRWGGRQLIPAELINECRRPDPVNPAYGLTLWLNAPGGRTVEGFSAPPGSTGGGLLPAGFPHISAALGAGRNGLYILPGLEAVVVRQRPYQERTPGMAYAEHARRMRAWNAGFTDRGFLELVVQGLQA
jgi:CubicO group peptidase (beta-lactamase class C family)